MPDATKNTRALNVNLDLNPALLGFGSATLATPAHHRIVKHFASPLLLGPPPSELLLEIVMHLFTEEEAEIVACLPPLRPRTAEKIARLAGQSAADTERVLKNLAENKFAVLASGKPRKYTILPIVPGTFEMVLMTPDLSTRNAWHQRFAALFERLWETGHMADYPGRLARAPVRYLPVAGAGKTLYMAWPSESLEQILEPFRIFAVGHCQCRTAMNLVGKGCGRATENCAVFGAMARPFIARGLMRKADRAEILDIKRRAELEGSVTWMMNANDNRQGNASCSCCGCCCHALRGLKTNNAPGLISKPHFLPVRDVGKCTNCGRCAAACPMDAMTLRDKAVAFQPARCIGCGLCAVACKLDALRLEPVAAARPPDRTFAQLLRGMAPDFVRNSFRIWAKRLMGSGQ